MSRRVLAVTTAALVLLAGCDTGDPDLQDPAADGVTDPPGTMTEEVPDDPVAGTGQNPGPGECQGLAHTETGDYAAGDAGIVSVRVEDDRLVLDGVEPAPGWMHDVVAEGDDEVEIRFSGDAQELEFRAGIRDGLTDAEVCADDA